MGGGKIERLYPFFTLAVICGIWQLVSSLRIVPEFMLPSPWDVLTAIAGNFTEIAAHAGVTLAEAYLGLAIGGVIAVAAALAMDGSRGMYAALYPVLVATQAVPTVAIAPLLVLWMGYGIEPKIALVALVCFFPLAVSFLDGLRSADPDAVRLFRAMGASKLQILRHVKLPYAAPGFFAGLKVSVTYAVVGGVIAEWLGGSAGLGVFMTRVRKAYAFDKMFAVIIVTIVISLIMMKIVSLAERRVLRWRNQA